MGRRFDRLGYRVSLVVVVAGGLMFVAAILGALFAQSHEKPVGGFVQRNGNFWVTCSCSETLALVCTGAWMLKVEGENRAEPVIGQGLQVIPNGCTVPDP